MPPRRNATLAVCLAAAFTTLLDQSSLNTAIPAMRQDLFAGRERTRALGVYATVGGIAATVGPLFGGAVIGAVGESEGWRWVLLLNLPFGLITVPLAIWLLPASRPAHGPRPKLDLPGLALLGVLTLSLLLPFIVSSRGWLLRARRAARPAGPGTPVRRPRPLADPRAGAGPLARLHSRDRGRDVPVRCGSVHFDRADVVPAGRAGVVSAGGCADHAAERDRVRGRVVG